MKQEPSFWIWMFGPEGESTYILIDEKLEWAEARTLAEKTAIANGVRITRSDIFSTPEETRKQAPKGIGAAQVFDTR